MTRLELIGATASGLLFGFGLSLSQMVEPQKVQAFLDLAGDWDPSLALVMGGAVVVTALLFPWVLRRPASLSGASFSLPTRQDIDAPLVLGAATFGIGWGLTGYCPGPALSALTLGFWEPWVFVPAMLLGAWAGGGYARRGTASAAQLADV